MYGRTYSLLIDMIALCLIVLLVGWVAGAPAPMHSSLKKRDRCTHTDGVKHGIYKCCGWNVYLGSDSRYEAHDGADGAGDLWVGTWKRCGEYIVVSETRLATGRTSPWSFKVSSLRQYP